MRGLLGVSICILLSACALTFDGERKVTRRPDPGQLRVRADTLPGAATLGPDGTVRFQLELAKLCQRDQIVIEEIGVDRRKRFTGAGVALTAVTLALIPLGIFMFTQIDTGEAGTIADGSVGLLIGGVFAELAGTIGGGFLLAFRYAEPTGYPDSKGYQKLEERTVPKGTELLACADGASAVGDLVLTTPWGGTSTAKAGIDGAAVFTVDWAFDRAGTLPRDQLATGWKVTSSANTTAAWRPADGDVTRIAQLIAQAHERVIVGSTPAQLATTLDVAKPIEIGGGGQLAVTVRNTGGSTATKVTAKTRSSIAALHGLTFELGTIQPGATATRSADVKLGTEVVDDSATVLLAVTDGTGTSVEVTKRLTLTRALCPGGKLTRTQYDEKRAKLKKTVSQGLLTQEEFERLDGELLRCLE